MTTRYCVTVKTAGTREELVAHLHSLAGRIEHSDEFLSFNADKGSRWVAGINSTSVTVETIKEEV